MKECARQLQKKTNLNLSPENHLKLKFSTRWIHNFKKRHCLKLRRTQGEARSADENAITEHMPFFHRIMLAYHRNDIWNADEFGLFYRQPPTWTLSSKPLEWFKLDKTRLTFRASCNASGTEKFPLMVINRAWMSHAFKKKTVQDRGFDYHANEKVWMTYVIFSPGFTAYKLALLESQAATFYYSLIIVRRTVV